MKTKIKKILIFVIILLISATLSWFICAYNDKVTELSILNDEIVISMLSGLLALLIAIITLIFTLLEKISDKLSSNINIESIVSRLFNSLKQDTWAILVFLTTIILTILLRDTDFPYIEWPSVLPFSKLIFVYFLKLLILFLSISATADMILTLFSLLTALSQIKRAK